MLWSVAEDAPQALTLIEDMPASIVMAEATYDADRLRQAITDRGATAVIPSNRSRARKHPPAGKFVEAFAGP